MKVQKLQNEEEAVVAGVFTWSPKTEVLEICC